MMKKITSFLLALALLCGEAQAQVTSNSVILPQRIHPATVQLNSGLGNATLLTGASNGTRCNSITATNTDSAAHNITWQLLDASSNPVYNISVLLPVGAGSPPVSGGGPTVPMISPSLTQGWPVDSAGNQYIDIGPGQSIVVINSFNAITTGFLYFLGQCWDY